MFGLMRSKKSPAKPRPKFDLGYVSISSKAQSMLNREELCVALLRHISGDWGDVSDDCRMENEESVKIDGEIYSVYFTSRGIEFWIITNGSRTATTVILPEQHSSFLRYKASRF